MRNKLFACAALGFLCVTVLYGCGKKSDSGLNTPESAQEEVYTKTQDDSKESPSAAEEESSSPEEVLEEPTEENEEETAENLTDPDAEWEYYTASGTQTEVAGYTISTGTESAAEQALSEDQEAVPLERPSYTASDYVSIEVYVKPVFPEPVVEEVTEEKINEELASRAQLAGLSVSAQDVSALTDEDAREVSAQKYQTMADYRDYLKDMLSVRAQLTAAEEAFLSGLSTFYANVTVSGVPEDVLSYDERNMDQEILDYAADLGYQTEDIEALKANTQLEETLDEEHREKLTAEMCAEFIAEKEGITVTDMDFEEMCTLYMTAYGHGTKEELLQSVDEKEIRDKAMHVKICIACRE